MQVKVIKQPCQQNQVTDVSAPGETKVQNDHKTTLSALHDADSGITPDKTVAGGCEKDTFGIGTQVQDGGNNHIRSAPPSPQEPVQKNKFDDKAAQSLTEPCHLPAEI